MCTLHARTLANSDAHDCVTNMEYMVMRINISPAESREPNKHGLMTASESDSGAP